jgi:hypothetical protein
MYENGTMRPVETIQGRGERAGHQWLMSVILASQEAEIRRIAVQSQPEQRVLKTLSQKNPS